MLDNVRYDVLLQNHGFMPMRCLTFVVFDTPRVAGEQPVANDGAHLDRIAKGGSGSYVYRVCEAGTNTCSNNATVSIS